MSCKAPIFAFAGALLIAAPAFAAPPAKKPTPKEAAEKAAKEKAEKEAAEKAAKEAAEKEAADKAAKEKAEKEAAEKEAAEKATKEKAEKEAAEKAEKEKYDPFEDPLKRYNFIGLRFRDAIVPKFLINAFGASGGGNVNVPMVGPEFSSRRDRLELDVALMFADFTMNPTLFKGKSEPDTAYEMVASGIRQVMLTLDVLYEIPIEKDGDRTGRFSFLIGGGIGFGFVMGPLYRSQVYPLKPGASGDDPSQWGLCRGTGNPNPMYCENPNSHFSPSGKIDGNGSYAEASWAGGGSKPILFPWLALPQLSFRYKPIKQLQTRFDTGFSTAGFFFGLSAGYGL